MQAKASTPGQHAEDFTSILQKKMHGGLSMKGFFHEMVKKGIQAVFYICVWTAGWHTGISKQSEAYYAKMLYRHITMVLLALYWKKKKNNTLGEPQQRLMQRRDHSCGKATGLDFWLCVLLQSAEGTTIKKVAILLLCTSIDFNAVFKPSWGLLLGSVDTIAQHVGRAVSSKNLCWKI